MSRYIILVERDEETILPIVDDNDNCAVFRSHREAEECAANSMACQAWGYAIVDLDDIL